MVSTITNHKNDIETELNYADLVGNISPPPALGNREERKLKDTKEESEEES